LGKTQEAVIGHMPHHQIPLFALRIFCLFPFSWSTNISATTEIPRDSCFNMAHVEEDDLVASTTEGFKLGEKKTLEEYTQLGERTTLGAWECLS
jgi:hypothetical protein